MATLYSDIAEVQNEPTAKTLNSGIKQYGNLAYCEAKYTVASGDTAADVVRLVQVPAGFRLVTALSTVVSEGMGSGATATVDVGDDDDTDSTDADRYADGLDVAAAGVDIFDSSAAVARLTPYTTQKTSWITATLATWSGVTTGQELLFKLVFARD